MTDWLWGLLILVAVVGFLWALAPLVDGWRRR
jgi:hypothetical protein